MKLINTVKNVIVEKLGVPDNIVEAKFLYDKIIQSIPDKIPIDLLAEETYKIRAKITVGDMLITNFIIEFTFNEYPENILGAVNQKSSSERTNDFKLKIEKSNEVKLVFDILGSPEMKGSDVKNILTQEKTISILAHEIKHQYDDYKIGYESYKKRVDYDSKANVRIGRISTVNNLIVKMYFIHSVENLVRPSELYSLIKTGNITREQFYKFFTENEIFKKLKIIKNTTYQNFIQNLKDNIDEIKTAFDANDIDYQGLTDDQIIYKILKITINYLAKSKASGIQNLLADNALELQFGFIGKKKKYFENYLESLNFNLDNPEAFFKKEIKIMNILADKMIKKLSKLYDMIETGNEKKLTEIIKTNDVNPLPKTKFDTEFRYIPQSKRHPIKNKRTSK